MILWFIINPPEEQFTLAGVLEQKAALESRVLGEGKVVRFSCSVPSGVVSLVCSKGRADTSAVFLFVMSPTPAQISIFAL